MLGGLATPATRIWIPLMSTAVGGDCHSLPRSLSRCACADGLSAWHARLSITLSSLARLSSLSSAA